MKAHWLRLGLVFLSLAHAPSLSAQAERVASLATGPPRMLLL